MKWRIAVYLLRTGAVFAAFSWAALPGAGGSSLSATSHSDGSGDGLPLAPLKPLTISTDEGTWIDLDVSPHGDTIVFAVLGKLFLLPIRGGIARQLTSGPSYEELPRFSPDGQSIVFSSDRGGYIQLWKIPSSGEGVPTLVPADEARSYRLAGEIVGYREPGEANIVSPDRRYEIRTTRAYPPGPSHDCPPAQFILKDLGNNSEKEIASAGADCNDFFLPHSGFTLDGKAFITAHSGKLWRIEIPSGTARQIPFQADIHLQIRPQVRGLYRISDDPLVHARHIETVSLSPDKSRAAFSAFGKVWTVELPRGTPRRLTSLNLRESYPAWSPDGKEIAFITWTDERGGDGRIYVAPVGGGAPSQVSFTPGYYSGLTYSSNGAKLFAFMRPVRATQRYNDGAGFESLDDVPDAELVSVSVKGGSSVTLDVVDKIGDRMEGALAGVHVLPGQTDAVARYVPLFPVSSIVTKEEEAGAVAAVPPFHTGAPGVRVQPTALVKFRIPPPRFSGAPWSRVGAPTLNYAVLSPSRDHALVIMDFSRLFLVDVPPQKGDEPTSVLLDQSQTGVREITTLSSGAEYPRWLPDGRTFTYSFGHTLFVCDLNNPSSADGKPTCTATPIDVTMPRDLPHGVLALRNARIITMKGNEVLERGDVVIRGRRIIAIGPAGKLEIPPDAHVVDLAGKTLMPGLFDLHRHLRTRVERTRVWQLEADLSHGVTSGRDVQAFDFLFMTYADQLAAGEVLGSRYESTGFGIASPSADVPDTEDNARAIVSRYAEQYQVASLKEYGLVRRDWRERLIMAAGERGLNVTSHGEELKQLIQNAVDGYGGFEHPVHAVPLYRDVRELLAKTGITLSHANSYNGFEMYYGWQINQDAKAKLERTFPPNSFQFAWGQYGQNLPEPPPIPGTLMPQTLAAVVKDGGHIATGSHGNVPGIEIQAQLWGYAQGGMPLIEVLRAGTLRGAQAMGVDNDLGSLEPGKIADLLILNANPLDDIRNANAIDKIVFNGRLRDAITLDELWPEPRRMPQPWWLAPQPE
jgi:imidazolonepropionase-like amidohydrolase/WD40 repeat protein